MKSLLSTNDLSINLKRVEEDGIVLTITSDYSGSERKQQLYVNEKRIASDLERFWKSIKTKKVWRVIVNFFEIDWYDSDVDVYEYPYFLIKRGLKKTRIDYDSTGSIPKEWGVNIGVRLHDTTAVTPILEVLSKALESWWSADIEKRFKKEVKAFMQKKAKYFNFSIDEEELPKPKSYHYSYY